LYFVLLLLAQSLQSLKYKPILTITVINISTTSTAILSLSPATAVCSAGSEYFADGFGVNWLDFGIVSVDLEGSLIALFDRLMVILVGLDGSSTT